MRAAHIDGTQVEQAFAKRSPNMEPPNNRKMKKKWTRQVRADATQAGQSFAKQSRNMKAPHGGAKNLAPSGSNGVGGVGVTDANVGITEQERMLLKRRKRWV